MPLPGVEVAEGGVSQPVWTYPNRPLSSKISLAGCAWGQVRMGIGYTLTQPVTKQRRNAVAQRPKLKYFPPTASKNMANQLLTICNVLRTRPSNGMPFALGVVAQRTHRRNTNQKDPRHGKQEKIIS